MKMLLKVLLLVLVVTLNSVSSREKTHKKVVRSYQDDSCTKAAGCPERRLKPKSCLDHLKKGASKCGVYKIYDSVGNSFPVYCDMNTEPGNAWTLVMSWSTRNRGIIQFKARPFRVNAPVKENAPNFNLYRQTLSRMQSIKSHSTHWRATCSYPTHSIDYRDYVSGSFRDFDVMSYYRAGACKKVGYINIRGHVGIHTTARWWQGSTYFLYVGSSYRGCGFAPVSGAVGGEDNFGYYNGVLNPDFRCTVNDKATTQWWFGGHL